MRAIYAVVLAAFLITACYVSPGYRGEGVVVAPALPPIVVLENEPYYFHGGFYYHYRGHDWAYSRSRGGPWTDLPRNRYPHEVRFKNRDHREDRWNGEHGRYERHER